ncbi:RNA polymerase sigma factor [Tunicatimonas pelagia]|uniref:RNA polymerase sigma factor n=1 Tax=Tunicatimonas pelagia TaxID=931531 RepID=UPI002665927E|nr:sigma-70 family RNA polymerase sigma factor [Tunicatimonas pelagia]WKN45257.1 sigma-70 family RNA polymerase sigma factor [Tunicatimonas pelagia]
MEDNQNDHNQSPEEEIKKLYNDNVRKFVGKYQREFGQDNCLTAFHDAVLDVYFLINNGRKTKAKGEIKNVKALLFRIGYNKLIDITRKDKRDRGGMDGFRQEADSESLFDPDLFYSNERIERIRAGIRKLGKGCQKIIFLRFDKGYDHKKIAEIMEYASADVAKTRISVCVDNLRKKVFGPEQTNK